MLNRSLNNICAYIKSFSSPSVAFLSSPCPSPTPHTLFLNLPFCVCRPRSRVPAGQRAEVLWNSCISSSSAPSPHSRGESTCQLSLPRASWHLKKCSARAALQSLLPSLKARPERTFSFLHGLLALYTVLPSWAWKSWWTEKTEGKVDRVKKGVNEKQNTLPILWRSKLRAAAYHSPVFENTLQE